MKRYRFHPLCELFPTIEKPELEKLAEDIKKHGLREPILLYDGKIIDGRNRYLACELAGIEPEFKKYDGANPAALVASLNLHRRHLSVSQRASIAAELATNKRGGLRVKGEKKPLTHQSIAQAASVSVDSIKLARRVKERGSKALRKLVAKGEVSVSKAARAARLPKAEQVREVRRKGPCAEFGDGSTYRGKSLADFYGTGPSNTATATAERKTVMVNLDAVLDAYDREIERNILRYAGKQDMAEQIRAVLAALH